MHSDGDDSFPALLSARCAELGLFTAKDVARKLHEANPSLAAADFARSIRNWQTGRNVPRQDFFRMLMATLEIDSDPALRARWLDAYARAQGRAAVAETVTPAPGDAPLPAPAQGQRPMRWTLAAVAMTAALVAVGVARYLSAVDVGLACDAAAGAAWDPGHNPDVPSPGLADIGDQAVGTCREAVAGAPDEPRYLFQLGRALTVDTRIADGREQARAAFERASAMHYAPASLSLALMHEAEARATADPATSAGLLHSAAHLYDSAAEANLPFAVYCAALASAGGWSGHPVDTVRARALAARSADLGYAPARWLVAALDRGQALPFGGRCVNDPGAGTGY